MGIEDFMEEIEQPVSERVNGLAEDVHDKLGLPMEEVIKQFKEEIEHLKDVLDTDNEELIQKRAWTRVRGEWKRQLKSDAKMFNGVVLGASDPFDLVSYPRRQAKQAYKEDPEEAIEKGLVNEDGEPLDTREKFSTGTPNPNYGKPLPDHRWIRNVVGICKPIDEDEVSMFTMTLNDNQATDIDIPSFKPVRFRANEGQEGSGKPGFKKLNPWSGLQFNVVEDADFSVEDVLAVDEMDKVLIDLEEIPDWHARNATDPTSVMAVEGDVEYIADSPNQNNSLRMVIDSDELGMDDYTVWVPEHEFESCDFGAGSRVMVVGSTTQSEFNGETDHMINAWGIYAYPELKIAKDEVSSKAIEQFKQVQ